MAVTKVADVIVPRIFSPYVQQLTEEKSRIVQAGVMGVDASLSAKLSGGGLTFDAPSMKDLANDADNIGSDDDTTTATPVKTGAANEIAVRLERNQGWSSMDLTADLAGTDPMRSVADRVSAYWARRLQAAVVATLQGVFADNAAAPAGSDTHVQNDLTVSIIGGAYSAGVTDFNAGAFIDTLTTMGDSSDGLSTLMVHSIVYSRMLKNNLIDFMPDSEGRLVLPTYMGKNVIIDDGLPNPAGAGAAATSAGIFHSWVLGPGCLSWGVGNPKMPTEVERKPGGGNGAGQEILWNRIMWCIHPKGHAFIAGTIPVGGPSNATTANNLAHADSWSRRWPERKQIKIARLITRES